MDEHIDDIGLRIETEVPNVFQNHGLGDRTSGMAQQQFEESKFPGLEFDFLAGANDFPREEIHFQIGHRQMARFR